MIRTLINYELWGAAFSTAMIVIGIFKGEPWDFSIYYMVAGLIAVGYVILVLVMGIVNGIDSAKINKEYHDRLPDAPINDKSYPRPREGGRVADPTPAIYDVNTNIYDPTVDIRWSRSKRK